MVIQDEISCSLVPCSLVPLSCCVVAPARIGLPWLTGNSWMTPSRGELSHPPDQEFFLSFLLDTTQSVSQSVSQDQYNVAFTFAYVSPHYHYHHTTEDTGQTQNLETLKISHSPESLGLLKGRHSPPWALLESIMKKTKLQKNAQNLWGSWCG